MALHFIHGVDLRNMTPQTMLAITVANECFWEESEDCIITSVTRQGKFLEVGYHGLGNAVDIAVRRLSGAPIPDEVIDIIYRNINLRIGRADGGQYDVVDERKAGSSAGWTGAHLHIEWDPK